MHNIPNYPSPEVCQFGERLMSSLAAANIQYCMGGLGGCLPYDPQNFPEEFRPYIAAYLEGYQDSVAITYAAMRTKELEIQNANSNS